MNAILKFLYRLGWPQPLRWRSDQWARSLIYGFSKEEPWYYYLESIAANLEEAVAVGRLPAEVCPSWDALRQAVASYLDTAVIKLRRDLEQAIHNPAGRREEDVQLGVQTILSLRQWPLVATLDLPIAIERAVQELETQWTRAALSRMEILLGETEDLVIRYSGQENLTRQVGEIDQRVHRIQGLLRMIGSERVPDSTKTFLVRLKGGLTRCTYFDPTHRDSHSDSPGYSESAMCGSDHCDSSTSSHSDHSDEIGRTIRPAGLDF